MCHKVYSRITVLTTLVTRFLGKHMSIDKSRSTISRGDSGATLIEYALLCSLIAMVAIAGIGNAASWFQVPHTEMIHAMGNEGFNGGGTDTGNPDDGVVNPGDGNMSHK